MVAQFARGVQTAGFAFTHGCCLVEMVVSFCWRDLIGGGRRGCGELEAGVGGDEGEFVVHWRIAEYEDVREWAYRFM